MTSDQLNWRFLYTPRFFLYLSLGLHSAFLLSMWSLKMLEHFGMNPFSSRQEVYQEFIQVDVVGLPDELVGQVPEVDTMLPSSEEAITSKEEEAKREALEGPNLIEETKEASRLAKEKAEKLRITKEKAEKEKALKQADAEARREAALKSLADKTTRRKLKGNILSQGTSTKGKLGTSKDRYLSLIAQKVKEHFDIYPWQHKKGLVSSVFIRLAPNGRIKEKRIVKPSKDPLFDSAIIRAVEEASPLPLPDEESGILTGITFEFRPDDI